MEESIDKQAMENSGNFSDYAMEHLKRCAKWMRLVAIFMYAYGVVVIILGIMMYSKEPSLTFGYIIGALIVYFPANYLMKSANYFNKYIAHGQGMDLEEALHKSAQYWNFIGILLVIAIAIIVLAMLVGGAAFLGASGNLF